MRSRRHDDRRPSVSRSGTHFLRPRGPTGRSATEDTGRRVGITNRARVSSSNHASPARQPVDLVAAVTARTQNIESTCPPVLRRWRLAGWTRNECPQGEERCSQYHARVLQTFSASHSSMPTLLSGRCAPGCHLRAVYPDSLLSPPHPRAIRSNHPQPLFRHDGISAVTLLTRWSQALVRECAHGSVTIRKSHPSGPRSRNRGHEGGRL